MKVGIITTWFERGAAYVSRQIRDSLSKEHDVFIYARGGELFAKGDPNWDTEDVTWGKKPLVTAVSAVHIEDLRSWVRDKKLDAVIFNEQRWWRAILAVRELNVRVGSYIDYYTKETVPCFSVYDFLICNTKRHLSVFQDHPQAIYIPWGTDTDLYQPVKKTTTDVITFFHSAGMNPHRKGTDVLLKAFGSVNYCDEAKLLIHSQVSLSDFFPHLGDLIAKMQATGKLTIINETVPAPGLYHLGDVYVYPSRLDGIGLSLPEAIACGLPVIATDQPPMNEFYDNSIGYGINKGLESTRSDGYYWPECEPSVDSLRNGLLHFMSRKKQLGRLKTSARRYAISNLNWTKNSKSLGIEISNASILGHNEVKKGIRAIEKIEPQKLWVREKYPRLFKLKHFCCHTLSLANPKRRQKS